VIRDELVRRLVFLARQAAGPGVIDRIWYRFAHDAGAAEAVGIAQIEFARELGCKLFGQDQAELWRKLDGELLAWGVAFGLRWERERCLDVLRSMRLPPGEVASQLTRVEAEMREVVAALNRPGLALGWRVTRTAAAAYAAARRAWTDAT
jgi:hypothetical protein